VEGGEKEPVREEGEIQLKGPSLGSIREGTLRSTTKTGKHSRTKKAATFQTQNFPTRTYKKGKKVR